MRHRWPFRELSILKVLAYELNFILLADLLDQSWDQASELLGQVICLKKPFNGEQLFASLNELYQEDLPEPPAAVALSHETACLRTRSCARILIADDVETNLMVTVGLLSAEGCHPGRCDTVLNGQEAVDRFKQEAYDLVLMDCQMPVLDGFGATRAIRAWEREQTGAKAAPIIGFTADVNHETQAAGAVAGMDGFLAKPVEIESLREILERYLPSDPVADVPPPRINPAAPVSGHQEKTPLDQTIKTTLLSIGLPEGDIPEIAKIISVQLHKLMDNLERDLNTENTDLARATSHVLKGSMANTIFPSLKEYTQLLHEKILEGDWEGAKAQHVRMRAAYTPIKTALQEFICDS